MGDRKKTGLGLALVLALPLVALPLSWLPSSCAHFRYHCLLPLPEIVLATGLFLAGAVLLRRTKTEDHDIDAAFLPPRWVSLPLLAVLAGGLISMRFSDRSYFGLGQIPRLGGHMAIFLLAAIAPRDRIGRMCEWWMAVAVLVAANGLLRLRSEPEFISTFGNWNFLGAYLAASVVIGISIGGTWSL